jgi:hypothetical protein
MGRGDLKHPYCGAAGWTLTAELRALPTGAGVSHDTWTQSFKRMIKNFL